MAKDNVPYDEARYLKHLASKNPPLLNAAHAKSKSLDGSPHLARLHAPQSKKQHNAFMKSNKTSLKFLKTGRLNDIPSQKCLLCCLAVAVIFCAGCRIPMPTAGHTPQLSYYASVDEDTAAKQLTVPTNKSAIYVLDKYGVSYQSDCEAVILDNRTFRELAPRTFCMAEIEPGQHKLAVRSEGQYVNGPMGSQTFIPLGKEITINTEPGHSYFFETMIQCQVVYAVIAGGTVNTIELNGINETTAQDFLKTYRLSASYPGSGSETPLDMATIQHQKDAVEMLLVHGADVNARDSIGSTPLDYAAVGGDKDIAVLLLAHGADVNAKAHDGATPLHNAVIKGDKEVVDILLAHGADVNATDTNGVTPLHEALTRNYMDIAELLRQHGGQDLSSPGTQIREAAQNGDLDKIKSLLKDNPDLVSSKDVNNGYTPLHWAALRGHNDVVEVLLAYHADIGAKDEFGQTPLHLAAFSGRKDVVETLLANKAKVNAKDNNGATPLRAALFQHHEDVVELLRQHGGHK